ncbi:ethyl tert-butyl ether degradation EthD [Diaporthe helianthi]|uniref:Ethyl tert-butyl ether degradation EthD n=1 Tax=Diaporthe helianthi TaxID=158607 RepID=A0A2P5HGC9_DIAHE|nr:ethyl tert-butyl ether degradation EthD [Diaporthe helianthi]
MVVSVTVLYPNDADAKYDIEYYKTTHMGLMNKHFSKAGLISWSVTTYTPGPDGSASPFAFSSSSTWRSTEDFKAAFQGEALKEILADVPNFNFANKQSTFLFGEISGST